MTAEGARSTGFSAPDRLSPSEGNTIVAIIPTLAPARANHLAQQLADEVQAVVVVDNSAGKAGRQVLDGVTWVTGGHNLGFGRAVMLGVSSATEDLVLILNDDVIPGPGFVTAMVKPFDDPEVHAVAAHLRGPGFSRVDSLGLVVDRTLRAADATGLGDIKSVIGPSGAAAAYRRSTLVVLGGYAPELFAYWEDVDLALRMWSAGFSCRLATDAVAEHARGSTLGYRSHRQRELDAFGRGFILGRYRAWLGPLDRLWVPVLDWPSLVRSVWRSRSVSVLRARSAGRRAGATRRVAAPARMPPRRSPLMTLTGRQRIKGTGR